MATETYTAKEVSDVVDTLLFIFKEHSNMLRPYLNLPTPKHRMLFQACLSHLYGQMAQLYSKAHMEVYQAQMQAGNTIIPPTPQDGASALQRVVDLVQGTLAKRAD